MVTNIKKAKIGGKLYDVTTVKEYYNNPDAYLPNNTAIEVGGFILPLRGELDPSPGITITPSTVFTIPNLPDKSDPHYREYRGSNVVDFSNVETMREFIKKQDMVAEIERDILNTPDNIFTPAICPNDAPAMVALKKAVIDKHIDLDAYAPRFGVNYNNEKRLFAKENISLGKIIRLCNALDINATLTLSNAEGEIANPMSESITVDLTEGGVLDE